MTIHGNRSPGKWRKSSYSSNGGDCVEIGVVDLNLPVSGWRTSSYTNGGEACVEVGMVDLSPVTGAWHKSSHSGSNGDCAEISVIPGGQVPGDRTVSAVRLLAVRDSKDPAGSRLHFTPTAWNTFAGHIKYSTFGHQD